MGIEPIARAASRTTLRLALLWLLVPGPSDARVVRIAYTAELHGNLMPCSCPTHPLGGLARRIGWIDSLRTAPNSSSEPLFLVDGGSYLPDASDFPRLGPSGRASVDRICRDAARTFGYDAIAGLDLAPNAARQVERNGFRVIVAAVDEETDFQPAVDRIRALGSADLVILLCEGDMNFAAAAAKRAGAAVAVASRGACFGGPIWKDGILILGPGTKGRYVGLARLDVRPDGSVRPLEVRLRPMDATAPAEASWRSRVEDTVLAAERESPGAFTQGE